MQNLKVQTHQVLSKMLQQLSKQKQQDQKNKLTNPQNQPVPVTCKQLIDLFSHNLDAKQKMLMQITFAQDLANQMNTQSFREKIVSNIASLNLDNNQFNIPQSQMPKAIINMGQNNVNKPPTKQKRSNAKRQTQPTVQSHPQYFRVDHQVCHKLFENYKVLPLGIPKTGTYNFQENQHQKSSMNYHKILQIFKDVKLNLQINQKLLILRSIKKFSFNQNFINMEQFIKIFKVIVHGLGFKQQIFQEFVKKKQFNKQSNGPMKSSKATAQKTRKNYRFKTDNSMIEPRSLFNGIKNLNDLSAIQNRKHPQLHDSKKNSRKKMIVNQVNGNASYLVKAMQNQKVSKITWQTLFNMRETSRHNFIVIPSFVRNANIDDL